MHFLQHPGTLCSSLSTSYIPHTKYVDFLSLQERRKRVSVTLVFLVWLPARGMDIEEGTCNMQQHSEHVQVTLRVWGDCLGTRDPDRIRQKTCHLEILGPSVLTFKPGLYVVSALYKCFLKTISL